MEKIKLLLYCTKAKNKYYDLLVRDEHYGKPFYLYGAITENFENLNGKIVAECDFEVEKIERTTFIGIGRIYDGYTTKSLGENELLYASKIDEITFINYLKGKNGYAIHIKNLNIFDEAKYIQDYSKTKNPYDYIEKAPQNMMYCYDIESFNKCEKKVLISIHPEWLCKILNGEKTIEVRKKVLRGMLDNDM